jgi:transcriptional regulator of acetoin/glycerol metabolism
LNEEDFEFLLTQENITQNPGIEFGAPVLSLHEMERVMLLKALQLAKGNRNIAAKILGVARSTLFEMLKRHKIQGPRSESKQNLKALYGTETSNGKTGRPLFS